MNIRTISLPIAAALLLSVLTVACARKIANKTTKSMSENPKTSMSTPMNAKHAPEWAKNCNIYEVNVRQYTKEGTFKAFEKHIPRLKNMGVDVLWLMPIQPIGVKNRKGSLGSYYSISDYKAINPEFGNLDDFKSMVNFAHKLGMKVMIDWVANHTSWDNVWIDKHPDWFTHKNGKIIPPVDDWADVADLNYDNKEMRAAMVDALKYWVKECNLDGYRCDVAMMVPMDFWDNEVRPALDKDKNLLWLCEAEGPEFHKKAFDITYGWDWHHLMNEIAQGKKKANALDTLLHAEQGKYAANDWRLQFTSNHDENTWNGSEYERMGKGYRVMAVLAATLPGVPLIYSGQESSNQMRLKFFDKDQINWGNYILNDFYQKLLTLKHKNKALWNGNYGGALQKITTNHDDAAYAFFREKEGDKLVVVCNLSNTNLEVVITGEAHIGDYTEVFSNTKRSFKNKDQVTLKPWEYVVYSNK